MSLEKTCTVYATGKTQLSVSGEAVGPFIIHRPVAMNDAWILPGNKAWHVTHMKSGLRFPWPFGRKDIARTFARRVQKLTDWDQVNAKMPSDPYENKGAFTSQLPTPEQKVAIKALAMALTNGEGEQ